MIELENVLYALNCRALDAPSTCTECSYYNAKWCCCNTKYIMQDALDLLRKQVPRVMTLEELQAIETPWNRNTSPYLWMENRTGRDNRWYPVWDIRECVGMIGTRGSQNYGVVWRVWSCRPSQEQMRDTPWEEEKDDSN